MDDRTQFVWQRGVLGWGVLSGLLFAVMTAMIRSAECRRELGMLLMTALPIFCVGGCFWGHAMWSWLAARQQARSTDATND
jgi:hypothetical protein